MGIYIKGMEMPTKCFNCPLAQGYDMPINCSLMPGVPKLYSDFDIAVKNETKPDWCPLIPAPDHGRLVDANALMLKIHEYIEEYAGVDEDGMHDLKWCAMKEAEMAIDNAPTIIPATE